MDEWYTSVQNLPVIWPDLSMIDSAYLRKVIGHEIRTQINAPGMWGTITRDWELLAHHLAATPLTEAELEEETVLLSSPSSWRRQQRSSTWAWRETGLAAME